MKFDYCYLDHGIVKAHGIDEVGEFDINGFFTSKKLEFTKRYIGQNSIQYKGMITPDGVKAHGHWFINDETNGGFELIKV